MLYRNKLLYIQNCLLYTNPVASDNLTYKQLKGGKNDLLLNRGIGLFSFNRDIGGDCFRGKFKLERLNMNKQKPTIWDFLGACVLGAILGAFLAYNLLGGF